MTAIGPGCLVALHLQILEGEACLFDTRHSGSVLYYVHGQTPREAILEMLLPLAVEHELAGKAAGAQADIALPLPFGPRDPARVLRVPRAEIESDGEVVVGDELHFSAEEGRTIVAKVSAIEGDLVVLDGNHPLAGKDLRFVVVVQSAEAPKAPKAPS